MVRIIKILFIIILLTGVLFTLLYFTGSKFLPSDRVIIENDIQNNTSEMVGLKAPYFNLLNVSGDRVKLSEFNGAPLIVFFWSTWDSSSSDQVKIFDDYLSTELAQGRSLVKVLGINSQEDESIPASFVGRGGYKVPIVVDSSGAITESYGVKGLPTIFFIDKNGVIRDVWVGVLSVRQIVDKVEQIIR